MEKIIENFIYFLHILNSLHIAFLTNIACIFKQNSQILNFWNIGKMIEIYCKFVFKYFRFPTYSDFDENASKVED